MIDLTNPDQVKGLKSNLHTTFDSPQGQETMRFLEEIGSWCPTVLDSNETNDVIARDANRKLIGTIKTILNLSTEQVVALVKQRSE